jgi:putative phosphoribosyl transferase
VLNDDVCLAAGLTPMVIDAITARERAEIERRERAYRGGRTPLPIRGRTVILVDDGLATGASMLAAVRAVRAHGPARVIVAVPVGPPETVDQLRPAVDDLVCLEMPSFFVAVGLWYEDFAAVRDEEIVRLLEGAAHDRTTATGHEGEETAPEQTVIERAEAEWTDDGAR